MKSLLLLTLFGLLIALRPADEKIRVFLCGDSTIAPKLPIDARNAVSPETGWGMPFTTYFTPAVEVQNHAVNGRSTKSFLTEGRWAKVINQVRPGDWVLIQFGHNDQKISDSTRCKCRIWHLLHFSSLPSPDKAETGQYWSRKFVKKLEEMDCGGSAELKAALQIKLQDYLHKRNLLLQSTRAIRSMYRQQNYWPSMQLILSIPGIGEINGAIILFELQDISRFKTFDNLCSYVGLIPDTDDSGDTKRTKGLTHRRNTYLREALIESSWVLIKKDPAMLMKYKDYCKRMHKNKAIIKIARHLLARINFVMRKQTVYVSGLLNG